MTIKEGRMNRSVRNLLLAGAAVAVPAAINAAISWRTKKLLASLPGDIGYYDWIHGRVVYYRMGHGDPLLLVHNPNPGGSAWEWRKIFPELANNYTVYALDLLGFGMSEKPRTEYEGAIYAELVHDFLQDVIGRRAFAIGSGLGAAYLVNVAWRRPETIERLVLANPTGITTLQPAYMEKLTSMTLSSPVLGASLYNSLMSCRNIAHELREHIYYDPTQVTPEMVDCLHTAAHQPGAQRAGAAYFAGRLDLPMRMAFADLLQPVLLAWGRDAYYTPVEDSADLLFRHPQARLEFFDECGMLPHDEKAGEFLRLVREFFGQAMPGELAA